MKCNALGVLITGMALGGAAAMAVAAADPAIRHRMCARIRRCGCRAMHAAEHFMR